MADSSHPQSTASSVTELEVEHEQQIGTYRVLDVLLVVAVPDVLGVEQLRLLDMSSLGIAQQDLDDCGALTKRANCSIR